MKFRKHLFVGALFLFPGSLLAVGQCSSGGYTIATINGVLTNDAGAKQNMRALKDRVGEVYDNQPIDYQYLLNPSHLWGIGDLAMSVFQKFFENETVQDYDLIEMLKDASARVKTQKLLLVAHSQGNFYANSFYDVVAGQAGGLPTQAIGVYSVANPASRVAGGGTWLTSDTDHVIAGLVSHLAPFHSIMPPNTHIAEVAGGIDPLSGHDFTEVYLKYRASRIVSGVRASLDKLSADPERREDLLCIDPPKISFAHKLEGIALNGTDSALTTTAEAFSTGYKADVALGVATYHAGVAAASWAYNTSVATAKTVGNTVVSVASAVSSGIRSLLSDTGNLAGANSAAVILATQVPETKESLSTEAASNSKTTGISVSTASQASNPVNTTQSPVADPVSVVQATPEVRSVAISEQKTADEHSAAESLGFGGGAVSTVEVKAAEVATTTEQIAPEATASTTTAYASGVFPSIFASTTLSSATATFSGTYNNAVTFDTISFELKNITLGTATSSILRPIATTTGEGLLYEEPITLESAGDWQYWVRLEDSVSASSTPWSSLLFFVLATSTSATTTESTATSSPQVQMNEGVLAQQTDSSARSQSHSGTYLVQTYIHRAEDPTWGIWRIKLRFKMTNADVLTDSSCRGADLSFPVHGGYWNGTQNNISAPYSPIPWPGITITADDATKTCTYQANFLEMLSLNAGTDYDMMFSSGSGTGESFQIYGSPNDNVPGEFGYFTYGNNANPLPDGSVADAFFEFATSTGPSVPQGISPLSPINTAVGTSSIAFSGTYRDLGDNFNMLRIEVEATSTAGVYSSSTNTFNVAVSHGEAVPFTETVDIPSLEPVGARWRVQAWNSNYFFGNQGSGGQWIGATGYSDWQYFAIDPTASTTPI